MRLQPGYEATAWVLGCSLGLRLQPGFEADVVACSAVSFLRNAE